MAELVVALDFPDLNPALGLVQRLEGRVSWFKVGLELFSAHGPESVSLVRDRGAMVFLDLKLLDIPSTVRAAVRAASRMGAGMVTVHLSGGRRMVEAAVQGRDEGQVRGTPGPLILGVTLLTSLGREDIAWMGGRYPADLVLDLAAAGRQWGVDGLVCSAKEAGRIKESLGPGCILATPGIRLGSARAPGEDQARIATPGEAVAAGSDFLVVGRPIAGAPDPLAAANTFLAAMETPVS